MSTPEEGYSLRQMSMGLSDVAPTHTSTIPFDDSKERYLRRNCLELLCHPDSTRREPLSFGVQFMRTPLSVTYSGATPVALRYVQGARYAIATNDTEMFPMPDLSPSGGSLMNCLDHDGWVLPVRPYTSSATGARIRIVLTDNLAPKDNRDHLTLMIMEGDLGRVRDEQCLSAELDLSTLKEPHMVTQDRTVGTTLELSKRMQSWCMVGPTPRGCFGATVGIGRITICLDDLWEDIYGMLQRIYCEKNGRRGTLAFAFHQYDKYLKSLRTRPSYTFVMGPGMH